MNEKIEAKITTNDDVLSTSPYYVTNWEIPQLTCAYVTNEELKKYLADDGPLMQKQRRNRRISIKIRGV